MAPSPLENSVVAVTGGSGFIGRRVVARLGREPTAGVVVLDRNASPGEAQTEYRPLNLGEASHAELVEALSSVTHLVHLAAEKHAGGAHEDVIRRTNVLGTEMLFRAAREAGVRRVVFASSLYAYGRTRGAPLVESEPAEPDTAYGVSKLAGEQLCRRFADESGGSFVALRYFFAYGPEQSPLHGRASLIAGTFARLARQEPPVVHGDGSQALDYVFVDDVAEATARALASELTGEVLNVGSGVALPVCDLVDRMGRIAGVRLAPQLGPRDGTHGTRRVASLEKIERLLGWRPAVSLDEGLARTWASIRDA